MSSYFKGNRHPTCLQRFVDACEDEKRQDGEGCVCVCAGFQERFHLRPCAGGGVDGDVPAHLVKLSFDLSREF